jgi:hypothetical protein
VLGWPIADAVSVVGGVSQSFQLGTVVVPDGDSARIG